MLYACIALVSEVKQQKRCADHINQMQPNSKKHHHHFILYFMQQNRYANASLPIKDH